MSNPELVVARFRYTPHDMAIAEHFLDRYLDPVAEALTPTVAQRILDLHPTPDVLERIQSLGEMCNQGEITEAERDEYRALADAGTLISLLKAKARRALLQHSV